MTDDKNTLNDESGATTDSHYKTPYRQWGPKTDEGYDRIESPTVRWLKENFWGRFFITPVTWWRENVMTPFRGPKYNYYHQKFRRVPTIDQCYTDDMGCYFEANEQFKRDMLVDDQIICILRDRLNACEYYWDYEQYEEKCGKEHADYHVAQLNYFIKYGDLGFYGNVIDAYMKQKHRLVWERREKDREQRLKAKFPHLYQNSELAQQ